MNCFMNLGRLSGFFIFESDHSASAEFDAWSSVVSNQQKDQVRPRKVYRNRKNLYFDA